MNEPYIIYKGDEYIAIDSGGNKWYGHVKKITHTNSIDSTRLELEWKYKNQTRVVNYSGMDFAGYMNRKQILKNTRPPHQLDENLFTL